MKWIRWASAGAVVCATTLCAYGQSFNVIITYDQFTTGYYASGFVQGLDGNLYGTTEVGGNAQNQNGSFYRTTTAGDFTILYDFTGGLGAEGPLVGATLVLATDGNYYGTSEVGGAYGWGTIFKITSDGQLTMLHSFCAEPNCVDGSEPYAGLVEGTDGNFYGTTYNGGAYSNGLCSGGFAGCGTIFKISSNGTFTTLYSFCAQPSCIDGANPEDGLVQGFDGSFYGVTVGGGDHDSGTIFRINSGGELITFYQFCSQSNCNDGKNPSSGLIQTENGNFYGVTYGGGDNGRGLLYKFTPRHRLSPVYRFCHEARCADGSHPSGTLLLGTDGNLYGTTSIGGSRNQGTLFQVTPAGVHAVLHNFCSSYNCADGQQPFEAPLIQATDGSFYGTTPYGGNQYAGVAFSLNLGFDTFIRTLPGSGKVGSSVTILGTDLSGATAVTFDGIAATFTVVSATQIGATVPSGAKSGTVQVTTPGGTLTSNAVFRVLP